MKKSLFLKVSLFFLLSGVICLNAQEAIVASGGESAGSGGTTSFSVGQVAVLSIINSTGIALQGVQQPWEVFLLTGMKDYEGLKFDCWVYPNPVEDFLKLKVEGTNTGKICLRLHDALGRIFWSGYVTGPITSIPLTGLDSGIYLFSVTDENNCQNRTFKIFKNQAL